MLGHLIVVLLASVLCTVCGTDSLEGKCGELILAGAPDDVGFQAFAKRCPEECPYATKPQNDICRARCVSKCEKEAPWLDKDKKMCVDCVPGCTNCGSAHQCAPTGCREELSFTFRNGQCVLPVEGAVKGLLKWVSGGLMTIVIFLLCCFGGVSHMILDVLAEARHLSGSKVPLLDESEEESQILEEEQLQSDPQSEAELTTPAKKVSSKGSVIRQSQPLIERKQEAITNWDAMLHGLKAAQKSSIRASRARRQIRRYTEFGHKRKRIVGTEEKTWVQQWLWLQSESVAGIGLLLFRNTQKFYCWISLVLFVSMLCIRMVGVAYLTEVVQLCSEGRLQADRQFPGANVSAMVAHFQQYCCMAEPVSAATWYAIAMFWWGVTIWVIIASFTVAFCKFQMSVVEKDESFQQAKGVDEQDYTLFLSNVPTDITSEATFMRELMKKFTGGEDKIYGVSIVYNVRQQEWCDRIQDMLENLVRYDLATQEAYSEKTREMYIRTTTMEEIKQKVEQDKKDFVDLLTGKGEFAEARAKHNLGSGEAYVVFKRKVDLKMTVPCTSGIHWDLNSKDRYRIIKVSVCQWEPSDVMWMDCVPTNSGKRFRLIHASIKMVFILSMLFVLTACVFYSSILPYQEIGADPIKHSTNFVIMNNLLGFVCGMVPGMPVGLAQGIGYTRMNDMEGLIFYFIMGVFGTWNLTAILIQWGVFALDPFELLTNVSQMDATKVLTEINWSAVVPRVMFPGQMVIGYILNEVLSAFFPVIIPAAISLCIFVLGIFPDVVRMKVAKESLQMENWQTIDARRFENLVQLQPYRLSAEYAFMIWVPMLSMSLLLFLTDLQLWIFGGLVIYSVLMFSFPPFCIHTMRDTSFDSTKSFAVFINSWGQFIGLFPVLSVWWSMRLDWVSGKIAIIMSLMTWCVCFFLFKGVLLLIGFDHVMAQSVTTGAHEMDEKHWKAMEENDRGFEHILNANGYSWWNMNPIYVLKHRYCPDLAGHEILPCHIPCWSKGYLTKTFVEIGRDWRFRHGEDFDLAVDEGTERQLAMQGVKTACQEEFEELENEISPFHNNCVIM